MHIRKTLSGWLPLAVFAVGGAMVAADPAFAKTDMDQLTIGGEVRVRYEIRNNTSLNSNNSNESAASHRVRVNVGYDLTPDVSFFAQIQDARIWGNEAVGAANSITGVSSSNNNGTGVDLHQGYILLKNVLVPGLSVKAGRQEITFGDQRLIGNFNWSQIGIGFDAVRLTHSMPIGDVDLFWARINDSETGASAPAGLSTTGVLFPGNGTKATTDQDLYGLYVTLKAIPNWTVEPYLFLLKDSRTPGTGGSGITTPQTAGQARSTVGGRINGKAGGLDATAEMAWQTGSISSGTAGAPTNDVHINAWAGAFRAGYTLEPVPMKPRIGIEIDYASGDGCVANGTANGNSAKCKAQGHFNTFDNLFPTNHFKFGAMDLNAWRNSVVYQGVFDVKPSPVSKFQVNVILMRLANRHDNWYRASQGVYGVTGAANDSASLGRELDVHYWHTFKEKFKFEIGAGHFWAGQYVTNGQNNINGGGTGTGNGSGQNWGYVMGSILF